jgi:hypothetical protein
MLNVIMMSVIMLNVVVMNANMLSVVVLNVIMLNVIMLSVVMTNAIMLNVVMMNIIMLSVVVLNVIILSAIMPNVVAPKASLEEVQVEWSATKRFNSESIKPHSGNKWMQSRNKVDFEGAVYTLVVLSFATKIWPARATTNWHYDTQNNDMQLNVFQHDDMRHGTMGRDNGLRYNDTQYKV